MIDFLTNTLSRIVSKKTFRFSEACISFAPSVLGTFSFSEAYISFAPSVLGMFRFSEANTHY